MLEEDESRCRGAYTPHRVASMAPGQGLVSVGDPTSRRVCDGCVAMHGTRYVFHYSLSSCDAPHTDPCRVLTYLSAPLADHRLLCASLVDYVCIVSSGGVIRVGGGPMHGPHSGTQWGGVAALGHRLRLMRLRHADNTGRMPWPTPSQE